MMSKGLRIGSMLLLAGALGMGGLFVTAIQGQVIHPDQMVGGLSLQGDSVQEGSTMPNEPGGVMWRRGSIVGWLCRIPILPTAWTQP